MVRINLAEVNFKIGGYVRINFKSYCIIGGYCFIVGVVIISLKNVNWELVDVHIKPGEELLQN